MEDEVIKTVLNEVLQELKEVKQQQVQAAQSMSEIKDRIQSVDDKLLTQANASAATDLRPITTLIKSSFDNLKTTIDAQPKSIINQYRLLLFPEHNATEYYKLVFGRLFFWMMIVLISTYLFVLSKEYIEGYTIAKQKEAETLQYRKAWNYLYLNSKKSVKMKMDSVWRKG